MGMTTVNTCLHYEYSNVGATYVERTEMRDFSALLIYSLTPQDTNTTNLNLNIKLEDIQLPDEDKQVLLGGAKAKLESLKIYLESK